MCSFKGTLEKVVEKLKNHFPKTLRAIILYGSWAKDTATESSDIDILALFSALDKDDKRKIHELTSAIDSEYHLDIVSATLEEFEKEKIPLYTAVKKEGKIIFGECDMKIFPESPIEKYREFFHISKDFEMGKIKMVEKIKKEHPSYSGIELCFVASKHAVQASLAMKGEGYSSKVSTLLPLCEKHFGKEIADAFRELFQLYIKSEYGFELLTEEESNLGLELAKKVMEVYKRIEREVVDEKTE